MPLSRRLLLSAALLLIVPQDVQSQDPSPGVPSGEPLAVYFDCRTNCDFEHIRTEIAFVNWVRDRTASDVHLLVTSQGSGGTQEYTFAFMGQRRFAGMADTLRYVAFGTNTQVETRTGYTNAIAAGLVRYVARTSSLPRLRITQEKSDEKAAAPQTSSARDPWNAWVFRIGANGNVSGEKLSQSRQGSGQASARRITEAYKHELESGFSYSEDRYTVERDAVEGGDTVYMSIRRDWNVEALSVKSLGQHVSAGLLGSIGSNTYFNQRRRAEMASAIELNFWPYAEATRHELILRYTLGYEAFSYTDTTIYLKTSETIPVHSARLALMTRELWGAANVSLDHRNYLNDASRRSTALNGSMNVRIFRGLSVNVGGSYSWVRDQIYLRKGERDDAEVLLRQQQLLTSFRYHGRMGLSYTFGSLFNNVVNTRF